MEGIHNPELQLAFDFVQYTNKNIFLTGKAGTGKTTFLKRLREVSPKRMIIVAPTGVAAINAGGVTIHSFFQLPFSPHIPKQYDISENVVEKSNTYIVKLNKDKIKIIKSLDLLVIDEISMVRADLLDAVDEILRRFRDRNKPFGGVQLLMIGDIQQLPPVVKDEDWNILKHYYNTMFFFGCKALLKSGYISVELKHIYRQSDAVFIDILNKIRENSIDKDTLVELNKRYIPGFAENNPDGFIILTTHNYQAQNINEERLGKLESKLHTLKATVTGEFPEYSYPTDLELTLKKGAQVMFIKNDISRDKLFYNGKIGTVLRFESTDDKEQVWVKCPDLDEPILVSPMIWENVKYTIDEVSKEIKEDITGTFSQIPLKLAWAITIHKSQGLTFEKAIIDARASFAHGQVYVALSRCKTLDGMFLNRPLSLQSIINDSVISDFSNKIEKNQPDTKYLESSKQEYEQTLISELFSFRNIQGRIFQSLKIIKENESVIFGNITELLPNLLELFKIEIMEVADKFVIQRQRLSELGDSSALQDRISKASGYFSEKLKTQVLDVLPVINIETDNKEIKKELTEALERLLTEASIKYRCLENSKGGFVVKNYLDVLAKASIEKYTLKPLKKQAEKTNEPDKLHSDLYKEIKAWRDGVASESDVAEYMILPYKTLVKLVNKLPRTTKELKEIKGFGKQKTKAFGEDLLKIINGYCEQKGMGPAVVAEEPELPVAAKQNSKEITCNLFLSGKTIEDIANSRGYSINTIEEHIAENITNGNISIEDLVSIDNLNQISEYFKQQASLKLSPAKEFFGDKYGWRELKFVAAYLKNKS
jgi:hypothetical protein